MRPQKAKEAENVGGAQPHPSRPCAPHAPEARMDVILFSVHLRSPAADLCVKYCFLIPTAWLRSHTSAKYVERSEAHP